MNLIYINRNGQGEIEMENKEVDVGNKETDKEGEAVKNDIDMVKIVENGKVSVEAEPIKIENMKNRMKVKCAKCKLEDILTEEDVKLLAHIVKRYNPIPNPNDYTAVLSIIKGNCTDGKKHIFIFDESFDKAVADTLKEYKDAIVANVSRKETLEKICILMVETTNQIKSLESELKGLDKKKEYTISEMSTGGILIDNIKLKFEKLTGTSDIEMWS